MTSKPIIAGTDGSGDSLRAVEWAAREAALRGAPLQVVCVPALPPRMSWHQPPGRPDDVAEVGYESYACALAAASERASELEPELAIETCLLFGPPARTLAETTADASMLVVGSRGAGLFPALVLGSASRYAATHGRCPVVVERQGPAWRAGEIVVGVGDLDQSEPRWDSPSRKRICADPAGRDARLVLLRAHHGRLASIDPAERAAVSTCCLSPDISDQLGDMVGRWRDKYPGVPAEVQLPRGLPGRALTAASTRADLVVLGRWPTQRPGPGVRSVTHTVLHHAHAPVAVTTPDLVPG